jgi:hypothetical protein
VGQVAEFGAVGLVLSIILAGIPWVMVSWSASHVSSQRIIWLGTVLGIIASIGIVYGMWRLAAAQFRNIK